MKAAITGASGLVGGNLAAALIDAGHSVRATRRAGTRTEHLDHLAIDWVPGDLDDPAALTEAFRGADVVFHCAAMVSILKRPTPALVQANVGGTRHVIEAVRAAEVSRLVHCSTTAAVGLSTDGSPCDERAPWNFAEHGLDDGYATTKHRAEEVVRAAVEDGLDAVIVNPTYMIGPLDSRPSSGQLVLDIVRGRMPGRTPGINNFVDVRDVVRGMILAWEKGERGERYILGGHNRSYGDFMQLVAEVAGTKAPKRNIPRPAAALLGLLGDLRESLGGEPLINSVSVRYAYSPRFMFTSAKAEAALGYTRGPLEDAIRDCIAWFRAHGKLP